MALNPSWPGPTAVTSTTAARKNLAGLIESDTAGNARAGVFPAHLNPLVTARADMNVDIAAFQAVAVQFGGPILLSNDGTIQLPSVLVSPTSGTNYYVVYVKQNESTSPGTDASNTTVAGVTLSTSSFAAARALLPTGALELATVQMPSGKTATNASGVTITQTFPYTAAEGGVVALRSQADQDAWTPAAGSLAWRIDTQQMVQYMPAATVPGWFQVAGKPTIGALTPTGIYSAGTPAPRVVTMGGRVQLEGVVASSSATFAAATTYVLGSIPSASAPAVNRSFPVMVNNAPIGYITVDTSGQIAFVLSAGFTGVLALHLGGIWPDKGL